MKTAAITLSYTSLMIWLFVKFPLLMVLLAVVAAILMILLAYKAPFDYELYPDHYQKPPLP